MVEALAIFFAVTLVMFTVFVGATVGGSYLYLRHKRRHGGVPLRWGVSHGTAARLHRRLHCQCDRARTAINTTRARGVEPVLLDGAVDDLVAQAYALDARLVTASMLPLRARHKQLATLRWRVIEHGRLATRVSLLAGDAGLPELSMTDASFADVASRLQTLADARRELRSA